MKTVCVLQHVEAEYLGLIEDHLEARAVGFRYCRPFVPGGRVPVNADGYDGLIVLGAGPFGVVSGSLLPSLAAELRLTGDFLERDLPVIGIGLGSAILATAAGA
jgi:GMP synthase-like glutamine amidotransferase